MEYAFHEVMRSLRIVTLAAFEPDDDFNFVAAREKFVDRIDLRVKVVIGNICFELDLFKIRGLAIRLLFLLFLVLKFFEVFDTDDWWNGFRRAYQDKIKSLFFGQSQSFNSLDYVVTTFTDEANLFHHSDISTF